MDEQIKSTLALQIAQLSLDKATFQAKYEEAQAQLDKAQARVSELEAPLDNQTQPAKEGE